MSVIAVNDILIAAIAVEVFVFFALWYKLTRAWGVLLVALAFLWFAGLSIGIAAPCDWIQQHSSSIRAPAYILLGIGVPALYFSTLRLYPRHRREKRRKRKARPDGRS